MPKKLDGIDEVFAAIKSRGVGNFNIRFLDKHIKNMCENDNQNLSVLRHIMDNVEESDKQRILFYALENNQKYLSLNNIDSSIDGKK